MTCLECLETIYHCVTPGCKCQFSTAHDLACHRTVCPKKPEWKRSRFDESWWLPVEEDLKLTALVRSQGFVLLGDWKVTLNQKGTCLKRRQI